jgi:hypothetical protein
VTDRAYWLYHRARWALAATLHRGRHYVWVARDDQGLRGRCLCGWRGPHHHTEPSCHADNAWHQAHRTSVKQNPISGVWHVSCACGWTHRVRDNGTGYWAYELADQHEADTWDAMHAHA